MVRFSVSQIAGHCVAVVPCLNEARTIRDLCSEILQHVPAVIVVDDGSSDDTASLAEAAGAMVLRRKRTGGKGMALRDGFEHARAFGFEWVIALDGDGQHSPNDIPKFFAEAESGGGEMIVGNRMNHLQSMPAIRRVVNRWMSRRISSFCGADLPDSQCGFRLVNLDSWARLRFDAEHFEIESELLVRFAHAGFEVSFVEIETRYGVEKSKIHPVRDTVRWFKWWNQIRLELRSELERPTVSVSEVRHGAATDEAAFDLR